VKETAFGLERIFAKQDKICFSGHYRNWAIMYKYKEVVLPNF
jgi:hypothetical protein